MGEEMVRDETIEALERAAEPPENAIGDGYDNFVNERSSTQLAHERLDKALNALSAGIVRIERKLDRILAMVTEARVRNR